MNCTLVTHPEHGGCCCKCRFRLRAFSHPYQSLMGWACIAFVFAGNKGKGWDVAYIGDFEHGMCELFMPLPWDSPRVEKEL